MILRAPGAKSTDFSWFLELPVDARKFPEGFREVFDWSRKRIAKRSKTDENSFKNRPKILPKSIENGSQSGPGGVSEEEPEKGSEFYPLLGPLGRVLARFSRRSGPQDGPKTEPKSFKNRYPNPSIFRSPLRSYFNHFGPILGAKMEPSWHQIRIQK